MPSSPNPRVRVRLNARLEMRPENSADPLPALLVSADAIGLTLRSPKGFEPGTILHLTGEPNLNESFTFKAIVTKRFSRRLPAEQLAYEEIHAELREGEGAYLSFLGALTRTYRELREDLRLILPLPARLRLGKRWVETHVENVSFGGLFAVLPNTQELSLGEMLEFEVRFPDGQTQSGAGLVVYKTTPQTAELLGGQPGIGLRLDFSMTSRSSWGLAIEALHKRHAP